MKKVKAPNYLKAATRRWFEKLANGYEMSTHHLSLLELAARSWDRAEEARQLLRKEGLTQEDKNGVVRAHPAVQIEKDSQIRFSRLVRELRFPESPPAPDGRPPRLDGRKDYPDGTS